MILVSSEHSFPFRLCNKKLDFNIDHLSKLMFAGEVSPKDMMRLLIGEWGVKEHLAKALVNHYGGHIYNTYVAITNLKYEKSMLIPLNPILSQNVYYCLNHASEHPDIIGTLSLLAEKGFVPIEQLDDPIAQILSEHDVAGVIIESGNVMGYSIDDFGACKFALVPSYQSMRLIIAECLINWKREQIMQ